MRSSQTNSLILGLMAIITLALTAILPAISRNDSHGAAQVERITNGSSVSPYVEALDRQRTALVRVNGGVYFRGATLDEAEDAYETCVDSGGQCDTLDYENASPPHRVVVDAFWMETTEVTYRQYVAFLNTLGGGQHVDGCLGEFCAVTQYEEPTSSIVFDGTSYRLSNPAIGEFPVNDVTWYGAEAYCEALGRRLPTEAEWEYAARGIGGTLYPWGNQWTDSAANVRGSVTSNDGVVIAQAQPVGAYRTDASADGVRDLAGNIAEWVADWYDPTHYLTLDATRDNDSGPATGVERVVRGGSWNLPAYFARSAQRGHLDPLAISHDVGFRCVTDG